MTMLVRLPMLALLFVCVGAQVGFAQKPKKPPTPADLKDVTVDGTVERMTDIPQGKVLQMKAAAGHPYSVLILPRESKLGLSGTAKPDFLKPGMLVSFNVVLPDEKDKKAEVESPPTELRIISPSDTNVQGLFEDKEKENTYYVVATVRTFKDGKLTVGAAGKTITVPVPTDMEIKVESSDPAFIRAGDSVKVMGKEVRAPKTEANNVLEGQVVAQTIDIKLQDALNANTFKKKPGGK
jgi:hypothetical protein